MHPGKTLIALGVILILAGLLLTWGGKIPFIGRLPGDIRIAKENFSIYFPLGTCILISVLVSLALYFFRR
ncbi:Protein of unknown function [Geoalkalibacter ferrihydriticus]|uniref:Membrane protein n=2 Tax=Geoalkalibacter ferrihydriticus TaxID=392333 RepID=A0A0C2HW87_9BACT|nr:DUF2905 domain-containing protein [Geoalkalibacter ferrihydriticus]KIH77042.1 membrane protein [Geoalkalibacter ferrihydriticus DSM 17813]SDL37580.1 Protein of unknown function [Geoalkalibacter ferrihydriticus]